MKTPFFLVLVLSGTLPFGCGKVSDPLPPVVRIPEPVADFAVVQVGYDLRFSWINPSRNIDQTLSDDLVRALIRADGNVVLEVPVSGAGQEQEAALGARDIVGATRTFSIQIASSAERLSAPSDFGPIRVVEVPGPVSGLRAEVDQNRILLGWDRPAQAAELISSILVYRSGVLVAELGGEAAEFEDRSYVEDAEYSYVVSPVRAVATPQPVEGVPSAPLRVVVRDLVPPGVPQGLALRPAESGALLTWNRRPESDLAGYRVFRRQAEGGAFDPVRADLILGTAYTDDAYVSGYAYRVSALDRSGNESPASDPVE